MHKQFLLEIEQEKAHAGTVYRVTGHQLRMRKALVNVLIDDVRFIQDEVTLDQDWHLAIGIHHIDVFRLVVQVDITDFKIHAFFKQDEAAAVGKRTGRTRVKHHHCKRLLKNQKSGAHEASTLQKKPAAPRQAGSGWDSKAYLTFFQNAPLSFQAKIVITPRNSSTHTPMRTRVFWAGSPIHCR